MYYVFNCIANEHDFVHVLMATLVLGFSIACAQVVFVRILVALSRRGQFIWMIAAGTVMGIGAWATHFIALLGDRPGFAVEFDGWITILSPLITIAGFVATAVLLMHGQTASTPAMTVARRLGCAVFATASVAAMHFFGMSALKASAIIEYDRVTNLAAFGIGFIGFSVAYFAGLLRSPRLASGIARPQPLAIDRSWSASPLGVSASDAA
jgi:diguanylate cyclase